MVERSINPKPEEVFTSSGISYGARAERMIALAPKWGIRVGNIVREGGTYKLTTNLDDRTKGIEGVVPLNGIYAEFITAGLPLERMLDFWADVDGTSLV